MPEQTIIYFDAENETHRDVFAFLWSAWTYIDQQNGQGLVQIGTDVKQYKALCTLDDLLEAMLDKPFEMKKGTHEWHLNEKERELLDQYVDGRRALAPGVLIRQVRKVVEFFKPITEDGEGSIREFESTETYGKFMASRSDEKLTAPALVTEGRTEE